LFDIIFDKVLLSMDGTIGGLFFLVKGYWGDTKESGDPMSSRSSTDISIAAICTTALPNIKCRLSNSNREVLPKKYPLDKQ
jgi:hypothetical protein